MREQLAKQEQTSAPAATPAAAPAKTRKLSYKEQRELDELPARIAALEAEQKHLHEQLADGSLFAKDNTRALALTERAAALDEELLAAMERWESLGG
jgi:ATP-binding cassette subfamily F protein uup